MASLWLQYVQGVLEALDLLLARRLPLLVAGHLGLALRLQLVEVSKHGIELASETLLVRREVRRRRLQRLQLRLLPLDLHFLRHLQHLAVLRQLVVFRLRRRLDGASLREALGKVILGDLEQAEDAAAIALILLSVRG